MIEHSPNGYPEPEHCAHVDYLAMDKSLPTKLIETRNALGEAERRAKRWDEGVMMLEWNLSRLPAQNASVLTPAAVTTMLGSIAVYSATGRRCGWMERVCGEMGWRS